MTCTWAPSDHVHNSLQIDCGVACFLQSRNSIGTVRAMRFQASRRTSSSTFFLSWSSTKQTNADAAMPLSCQLTCRYAAKLPGSNSEATLETKPCATSSGDRASRRPLAVMGSSRMSTSQPGMRTVTVFMKAASGSGK